MTEALEGLSILDRAIAREKAQTLIDNPETSEAHELSEFFVSSEAHDEPESVADPVVQSSSEGQFRMQGVELYRDVLVRARGNWLRYTVVVVSVLLFCLARSVALGHFELTHQVKDQASMDKTFTYTGGMANQAYQGPGEIKTSDGVTMRATFDKGVLVGPIDLTWPDHYQIKLSSNESQGVITLPDQTQISYDKGQFTAKTSNYTYLGGWRFSGTWQGKMTFNNGASYDGGYRMGVPDGQGSYQTTDGQVISGQFKLGEPQ